MNFNSDQHYEKIVKFHWETREIRSGRIAGKNTRFTVLWAKKMSLKKNK